MADKRFLRSWWAETWELSREHFQWWHPCGVAAVGAAVQASRDGWIVAAGDLWQVASSAGVAVALYAAAMLVVNGARALPRLFDRQQKEIARIALHIEEGLPYFEVHQQGMWPVVVDPNTPKELRHSFKDMYVVGASFKINDRLRPATNITGRLLMANGSLLAPPHVDGPLDYGYAEMRALNSTIKSIVPQNHPESFIGFALDYTDKATGRHLSQRWYWKWPGSTSTGLFQTDFHVLSKADSDRFIAYIQAIHPEWTA